MDDFFAVPAFKPQEAAQRLRKDLRELRLVEREGVFESRGRPVVRLEVGDDEIGVHLARLPARTPEWTRLSLRDAAQVRKFVQDPRTRLSAWDDD